MSFKRIACVCAAFTLLTGCGLMQEREARRAALANPALRPEIRAAIEAKQIRVGMTKQEVIAAWGNPCWWCYGTRQTSSGDVWEYNVFGSSVYGAGSGTYLWFDRTDHLVHWSR